MASSHPLQVNSSHADAANLKSLQRSDGAVVRILGKAAHCVVYQFNTATKGWERADVEGPLFVVRRNAAPSFRLVVLNRMSRKSFDVDITRKFQIQNMDPYIMFRVQNSPAAQQGGAGAYTVYGLWFHDQNEREALHSLLQRAVKAAATAPAPAAPAAVPERSPPVGNGEPSPAGSVMSNALLSAMRPSSEAAAGQKRPAVAALADGSLLTPTDLLGDRFQGIEVEAGAVNADTLQAALESLGPDHDFSKALRMDYGARESAAY